jgi:hypothetical protein
LVPRLRAKIYGELLSNDCDSSPSTAEVAATIAPPKPLITTSLPDPTPWNALPLPTLVGRSYSLRAADLVRDLPWLYQEAGCDSFVWRYTKVCPPGAKFSSMEALGDLYQKRISQGEMMWVLIDNKTGAGSGVYMFKDVQYKQRRVEIGGVWIASKARRTKANSVLLSFLHESIFVLNLHGPSIDDTVYLLIIGSCCIIINICI